MSQLDAAAASMMSNMIRHGSGTSLLPSGIVLMAIFALKTAIVVDCAGKGIPFFSPADRRAFATGLLIPRGVQVWISTFRSPRVHGSYTGHYGKIKTGRYRNFDVYVFTYVAGFLIVQLVAFKWGSNLLKRPRFIPRFWQRSVWYSASVPVWPPDGRPVSWPLNST